MFLCFYVYVYVNANANAMHRFMYLIVCGYIIYMYKCHITHPTNVVDIKVIEPEMRPMYWNEIGVIRRQDERGTNLCDQAIYGQVMKRCDRDIIEVEV